ncbi:MAG TPA: ABC transporter permease subunit [Candidatus Dormibacteraeota bacterium]|nr:ABC transporter permease subunit [Candidatus Dormibacteraeota bacterium]
MNPRRILAVTLKEAREYRRSPFIVGTMGVLPVIFLVEPLINIFRVGASVPADTVQKAAGSTFLLLLVVPAVVPATLAAYSVIGERDQGTLEPLLTTPIRREELLLGKALAAIVPTVGIAYTLYGIVVLCAELFATNHAVVGTLTQGSLILAELLFAPLLAAWSIWVGTAISVRAGDVRVAQQLGVLASLPPLGVTALVTFQVITPSVGVAVRFALILAVLDVALWRLVSSMFDRERLVTGARASTPAGAPGGGSPPG